MVDSLQSLASVTATNQVDLDEYRCMAEVELIQSLRVNFGDVADARVIHHD